MVRRPFQNKVASWRKYSRRIIICELPAGLTPECTHRLTGRMVVLAGRLIDAGTRRERNPDALQAIATRVIL
jgi:hypothetical protein